MQWSIRSNTNPDTRDVWTDTEEKNDVEFMLTDRSDSGITSPNCSHIFDDSGSMTSPLDLSIDHLQQDDIRKRLTIMAKRLQYDEDDRICILKVLSLLNNLESLSNDQDINGSEVEILNVEVRTLIFKFFFL